MNKREKRELQEKTESEYKKITRDLQAVGRNENPKKIQEVITEHFQKSDQLYPIVKKRLTGSAADARHLRNLLHLSGDTAKRINVASRPFELKKIILSLKREHGDSLAEYMTNNHVVNCLRITPTFEFFYGAIRREGLVIKTRRKRAKVEIVTTKAVTATEKNIATDVEQDSTPKEVELICNRIKDLTDDNPEGVQFFTAIVDPNSFTQTVENIFHTSFLVKEGKVGIKKSQNNKPVLTYVHTSSATTQERDKVPNQSILSFSMADYNKWKATRR